MNKQINLICSILALFCFVSMFVPVIATRYPAGEYYAPEGNDDYFYTGDYYLSKNYWSVTDYVFASQSFVWRIVLSIEQALLLLWSLMSVRGEAGKNGLAVAIMHFVVASIVVIKMMSTMWGCRWVVLVAMALDSIAAIVMAANVK